MSGSIFTEELTPASTPERRRAVEQLVARMGDAAEDLAALKAALEKRLAPRLPADPTDERLPLR